MLTWQVAQATVRWAPVNGKAVVLWLNVAGVHAVVEWQIEQSVGNPDVTWFGLVVPLKSVMWQVAHAVDVRL